MNPFEEAAQVLPEAWLQAARELGEERLAQVEELRLRRGFPMTVLLPQGELAVGDRPVSADDLTMVLENASQASAHTVLDKVQRGYVTLRGGHRLGLCGTVARRDGQTVTIRYLSSLSIRVARPIVGQAVQLLPALMEQERLQSTLILAPPGVGKTTLLRDLVRELSDSGFRVGVADERGELAALWQGEAQFDVGRHTDVLDGCPKGEAASILLRGMNPQVIAMDEITDQADAAAVVEAAGCGAALIATAHGADLSDLKRRPVYRALMDACVFRRVVVLTRENGRRFFRVEVLS